MIPVCIRSYLISVLRYKYLSLVACLPDTLYLRQQKGFREQKNLGDTDLKFFPPFIVHFLTGSSIKPLILCSHPIFNAHNLCLKQNVCMCVLIYKLFNILASYLRYHKYLYTTINMQDSIQQGNCSFIRFVIIV
jgi:hypothetical protein